MDAMADRIRTTLNTGDLDGFRDLLAVHATWGDVTTERGCPDRDHIVANYERLLADGVVGTVVETVTGPGGVACRVDVAWPDADTSRGATVFQAFRVRAGLITQIEGHDDLEAAVDAVSR